MLAQRFSRYSEPNLTLLIFVFRCVNLRVYFKMQTNLIGQQCWYTYVLNGFECVFRPLNYEIRLNASCEDTAAKCHKNLAKHLNSRKTSIST